MEHKLLARYPIGNPRRVWKQDNFILRTSGSAPINSKLPKRSAMTHLKARRAVKTTVEAGFTLMTPLWIDIETEMHVVRAAEQYGGNVLFADLARFGGFGNPNKVPFYEKSDFDSVLRDTKPWKCIKGYFTWDEPITDEQLAENRRLIDRIERERPDMLPYTVANPDYHTYIKGDPKAYADYIDKFLDTLDPAQMDFDYYPIGNPEYVPQLQLDNSTMWSNLETVRRAAQKRSIPFWFAYQGHHFTWQMVDYVFKHSMARSMAYAAVLHGAKAVACYGEFSGYVDNATGGKGIYFEEQKQLNYELLALGNTLMALNCLRVIHDDTLLPDHPAMEGLRTPMEESELLCGKLAARISVSEHEDAYGNKYLMVLNRDWDAERHVGLSLKNLSHVYEVSKTDGEERFLYDAVGYFEIYLAPGDLRLFRIQPGAQEPYTVEYFLDK